MFKVEYLNDHGDWILGGWFKNQENAEINADVKAKGGYKTRIIKDGKIVRAT